MRVSKFGALLKYKNLFAHLGSCEWTFCKVRSADQENSLVYWEIPKRTGNNKVSHHARGDTLCTAHNTAKSCQSNPGLDVIVTFNQ